jgi:hypothetical protein
VHGVEERLLLEELQDKPDDTEFDDKRESENRNECARKQLGIGN